MKVEEKLKKDLELLNKIDNFFEKISKNIIEIFKYVVVCLYLIFLLAIPILVFWIMSNELYSIFANSYNEFSLIGFFHFLYALFGAGGGALALMIMLILIETALLIKTTEKEKEEGNG